MSKPEKLPVPTVTCEEVETFLGIAAKMLNRTREQITLTLDRRLVPVPYPPGIFAEFVPLPDTERIVISVRAP